VRLIVRMDEHNHIHMHIPMLLTSIVILLTTLPQSYCDFDYSVCKERPYNCGNLSDIFYPFWGQNRPLQCGGGGQTFELKSHDDDNTTILIGSQNFTVKEINTNAQTMRVVQTDLVLNFCSPQFEDTYVNSTQFRYSPSVYNITIFYDCLRVTDFSHGFGQNFTCGDVLSYFVVEYEVLSNEFPRCKRRSHVPAEAPLDYTAPGAGYNNLIQVIDRGFEFRYDVSQDCTRCLGSEGECWSDCNDIDQHVLSCYYCPDGSHALHCSPSKSNMYYHVIIVQMDLMACTVLLPKVCLLSSSLLLHFVRLSSSNNSFLFFTF